MLIIDLDWIPFCKDGWAASDGKNEHAFLLRAENGWHVGLAGEDETTTYDNFKTARDYAFKRLGIEPCSREHLQRLFAAGYRR